MKALKNEHLVGVSLKAEVIDVEYQSLKVRFHVDDEQDKSKAKWINYSPVGSNAWYSLPHIANEVDVYFPNTDARTAIVISTSRVGHDGENTMKNPKDKVLATKWGAKLALTRSSIELSNSFTEIKLGDNIEISSNDTLTIESLNEINIGKTRRTTTDADGKKVSVVKETKIINIEAEEMVSFVVTGKSSAIEVDDEVVFTSAGDTISEGLEKLALPSMEIDNEVWEPKSIAPVEEVEENKGGFWNNVGKALLAAVAVAVVAVIAVASPISSAVFAALGAVATGVSAVSNSTATNLMINGGLATTSIALGAGAIISKLSRINSATPKGDLDFSVTTLDALSSNNWGFSGLKWGKPTTNSNTLYNSSVKDVDMSNVYWERARDRVVAFSEQNVLERFETGMWNGLGDSATSVVDTVKWVIKTPVSEKAEQIKTVANNRDKILGALYSSAVDGIDTLKNGKAEEKGRIVGRVAGDIAFAAMGNEVAQVGKVAVSTTGKKIKAALVSVDLDLSDAAKIINHIDDVDIDLNLNKVIDDLDEVSDVANTIENGMKVDTEDIAKYGDDILEGTVKGAPNFGRKMEYVFGNATGVKHNIDRSICMERQLNSIGIFDNDAGRKLVLENLTDVFDDASSILKTQTDGRIVRESLLTGPNGLLGVESVWDGEKLITVKLFGGK